MPSIALLIVGRIRDVSAMRELGLLSGASWAKGTKNTWRALSNAPMLRAFAPRASFDDTLSTTGRLLRKVAFTAIVTGVSVMPCAILASVLPVQGATSIS